MIATIVTAVLDWIWSRIVAYRAARETRIAGQDDVIRAIEERQRVDLERARAARDAADRAIERDGLRSPGPDFRD